MIQLCAGKAGRREANDYGLVLIDFGHPGELALGTPEEIEEQGRLDPVSCLDRQISSMKGNREKPDV